MPSIGSMLSIARTALQTQQEAMSVTAHNLANASTEGYARQRAVLVANPAQRVSQKSFGTGVGIADVDQVRDVLLDERYHREFGAASRHQARSDTLARLEAVFGEPSETGLSSTLDAFFSSWTELATSPTSTAVRSVVRQRGMALADKFHEFSADIDQIRQDLESRLQVAVGNINQLSAEIATYNTQIVAAEADGTTAPDLRDARAGALDELAGLLPVHSTLREDGSMGVASSSFNIVDGAQSVPLQLSTVGGTIGLEIVGRSGLLPDQGGAVTGLLSVLNGELPDAAQRLDDLAAAMVAGVNAVHVTGTNPDGGTGIEFFDGSSTTASSITLSTEVAADSRAIAASTPDGSGLYRGGASDVAEAISTMRDTTLVALGRTPGDHFRGLVSDIGLAVRSSTDIADVHRTLADRAETRRQSIMGVSVDEELVQMIQFQTAYQAAARMITAADDMLQTLLSV